MVSPGTDFDEFINGPWRRRVTIPAECGSYSVSDEVDDALFATIRIICRAARGALSSRTQTTQSQLVGTFYASGMAARSQQRSVLTVQKLLSHIDCIKNIDDVIRTIVDHIKKGFMTPFQIVVAPDGHNTSIFRLHLSEGDLPISNIELYSNQNSLIMKQYISYLKQVGKLFGISNLHEIVEIESKMAIALVADDDHGHPERRYLQRTDTELREIYKHIPWNMLWNELGFGNWQYVLLPCPHYFTAVDKMFRDCTIDMWRLLLKSQIIHSLMKYLPPPFDELHFSFYGRALHGDTRKFPQEKLVIECIRQGIPDALSELYVKRIGPTHAATIKRGVINIFKSVRDAMAEHIKANTWMDMRTKTAALDKIHAMIGKIAYPPHWEPYKGLILNPQEFVQNIIACNELSWKKNWSKLNVHVNKEQWTNGSLEVNAYYYPEENSIVMPLGILQRPFYDTRQSLAWNLGGIGCVIGHEICHGFDNEGREYDASGNFVKWWTPDDHRRFTRHAHELKVLLDNTPYAGYHVDGSLTLAEAIADLTGMRIALDTLLKHVTATQRIKALREFFTSFAVSWRKKERLKYARDILATDVHPPARIRINLTVAQIPEWYEAFNIVPADRISLVI